VAGRDGTLAEGALLIPLVLAANIVVAIIAWYAVSALLR
jgi:hypothetical protein